MLEPKNELRVSGLRLVNFRNHKIFEYNDLTKNIILISGPNGSGKTSILEAISAFNPARGIKSELPAMAVRNGANGWHIRLKLKAEQSMDLEMSWDVATRRRVVLLNRIKKLALTDTLNKMPLLWLHPGNDRLPDNPPASRLKFIDRLAAIFDKKHLARLTSLEKRRSERNQLMANPPMDNLWLETLEHSISQDAIAVAATRIYLIHQLAKIELSQFASLPKLQVTGTAEQLVTNSPALKAEQEFAKLLAHQRSHNAKSPFYCGLEFETSSSGSTGEQKVLTLSLIFAAALLIKKRLGILPILLLDELPAHLDKINRQMTLKFIQKLKAQTWITTTESKNIYTPKQVQLIELK